MSSAVAVPAFVRRLAALIAAGTAIGAAAPVAAQETAPAPSAAPPAESVAPAPSGSAPSAAPAPPETEPAPVPPAPAAEGSDAAAPGDAPPPAAPAAGAPATAAPAPVQGVPPAPVFAPAPITGPRPAQADGGSGSEAPRDGASTHSGVAVEIGLMGVAGGHFPENDTARTVEEALDAGFGAGVLIGSPTLVFTLGVEHLGLGKDHYGASSGDTLNVSYTVDTLWLGARLYLSERRPAWYVAGALGPALPRARGTGSEFTGDFTQPTRSFSCSEGGSLGAAAGLSSGIEADVSSALSVFAEGRGTLHLLSNATDAHGSCAPGTGTALSAGLRVGASLRFGS